MPSPLTLVIAHRQLSDSAPQAVVDPGRRVRLGPREAPLAVIVLEDVPPTVLPEAVSGVAHYLRLADATLIPLPPEDEGIRHRLIPWHLPRVQPDGPRTPLRLSLEAGDAYLAVAGGPIDSPAIARFVHLRDYFNAERLADALRSELQNLAPPLGPAATILVIEARPLTNS